MTDYLRPRDLGDGLVLRWAANEHDTELIAQNAARVFRRGPEDPPNEHMAAWMHDLGSGRHPFARPDHGLLVEDTRAGKAVASMWLIPTRWSYSGIPFGVGRPEAVASDPDYRRRGLIRALFEAFHARSAADGELVQGITGIPYYYRQFGYEFAIDLGGDRTVLFADIPALKEGEAEPYQLRDATANELPLIMELYERDRRRSMVSAEIPESYWRWQLEGINRPSGEGWKTLLIVDAAGEPCGYVLPRARRWGNGLAIRNIAVRDGVSLQSVIRPILRALRDLAPNVPGGREPVTADRIIFNLGAEHPVYDVMGDWLAPRYNAPYGWYVRVGDLPGFVRHVAPVLEQRLVGSPVSGYTGVLHLDFYRSGLRLAFDGGKLTAAEPWQRPVWGENPSAGFPPLVFLQLLFGRRSLDDLRYAFPDVGHNGDAEPVLKTLFPKRHSYLMELD